MNLTEYKNPSQSIIAEALLKIEAVKLSPQKPFTWASGWLSPIYCDNRYTLSFPLVRTLIKNELVALIKAKFPQCEAIAGVASAGVPQAAMIADAMDLPMIYVRPKPKDHGMQNLIEGKITPNQKTVVIEDLISTGGSSLKAVEALSNAGIEVLGMVSIFTYGFDIARKNFEDANVTLYSLSNYESLIQVGLESGYIKDEQVDSLKKWRTNPSTWGK